MLVNEEHKEQIAAYNPTWLNHTETPIDSDATTGWVNSMQMSLDNVQLPPTPSPPPTLPLPENAPTTSILQAIDIFSHDHAEESATTQTFIDRALAMASTQMTWSSLFSQFRDYLRQRRGRRAHAPAEAGPDPETPVLPPVPRESDGWLYVPPCFASSIMAGRFPWEIMTTSIANIPAILAHCEMEVQPSNDFLLFQELEDGTLIVKYRLDIRCSAHPDDECHIIPCTTISFDVTFPPAVSGMDGFFADALTDSLRTSLLEAVKAHVGAAA